MAFITPSDPRLGDQRQNATAMSIQEQLEEMARRKKSMSRFAQQGTPRGIPRARRPFRGGGAGVRAFGAGGGQPSRMGGGIPDFVNPGGGRQMVDPTNRPDMPRIGPPGGMPSPLEGGVFHPVGLGGLGGLGQGAQTTQPLGITPSSLAENAGAQSILDDYPNQSGGGKAAGGTPGSIPGGLVPLGGGVYYDPNTGEIFGGGAPSSGSGVGYQGVL